MRSRSEIGKTQRWVIKIGSSLLTDNGKGLDRNAIAGWVEQVASLCESGHEILLVSSGAVAEGMNRLGWSERPHQLVAQQAAAAMGQMGLVHAYESQFQKHELHTAQILLTHDDLTNRTRYLNARSTLCKLLSLGAVPIVNENDTVACDELRFGDNDTLAALVANLIEADLLIILTDQSGVYDADPQQCADATLIGDALVTDTQLREVAAATSSSGLGRGGMATKIHAAELAARSGTYTWIASGKEQNILTAMASGTASGTLLHPAEEPLAARKQWLAGHLQVKGTITLDDGAVKVLQSSGSSLLAVGVTAVEGNFMRGEVVRCSDVNGETIARGLVNYDAIETRAIMGKPTEKIEELLGYVDEPELIHRKNLVLL